MKRITALRLLAVLIVLSGTMATSVFSDLTAVAEELVPLMNARFVAGALLGLLALLLQEIFVTLWGEPCETKVRAGAPR